MDAQIKASCSPIFSMSASLTDSTPPVGDSSLVNASAAIGITNGFGIGAAAGDHHAPANTDANSVGGGTTASSSPTNTGSGDAVGDNDSTNGATATSSAIDPKTALLICSSSWGKTPIDHDTISWTLAEASDVAHDSDDPMVWKSRPNNGTDVWEKSTGRKVNWLDKGARSSVPSWMRDDAHIDLINERGMMPPRAPANMSEIQRAPAAAGGGGLPQDSGFGGHNMWDGGPAQQQSWSPSQSIGSGYRNGGATGYNSHGNGAFANDENKASSPIGAFGSSWTGGASNGNNRDMDVSQWGGQSANQWSGNKPSMPTREESRWPSSAMHNPDGAVGWMPPNQQQQWPMRTPNGASGPTRQSGQWAPTTPQANMAPRYPPQPRFGGTPSNNNNWSPNGAMSAPQARRFGNDTNNFNPPGEPMTTGLWNTDAPHDSRNAVGHGNMWDGASSSGAQYNRGSTGDNQWTTWQPPAGPPKPTPMIAPASTPGNGDGTSIWQRSGADSTDNRPLPSGRMQWGERWSPTSGMPREGEVAKSPDMQYRRTAHAPAPPSHHGANNVSPAEQNPMEELYRDLFGLVKEGLLDPSLMDKPFSTDQAGLVHELIKTRREQLTLRSHRNNLQNSDPAELAMLQQALTRSESEAGMKVQALAQQIKVASQQGPPPPSLQQHYGTPHSNASSATLVGSRSSTSGGAFFGARTGWM